MARLIIQCDKHAPLVQELREVIVTIGRDASNSIVIDDSTVSGHHGEIIAENGRYTLRDLNSSNGTNVNGQQITEILLEEGNIINFGSVEATFVGKAQTPNPVGNNAEDTGVNARGDDSLRSKLVQFGSAVLLETKRYSRLAFLKAKIEKIKRIDLANAHSALGRRAYEVMFDSEHLELEYAEIAELEKTISIRRAGVTTSDGASEFEKLKQAGKSAKMAIEAEVLESKLKRRFEALGQKIENIGPDGELAAERESLCLAKKRIEGLEAEFISTVEDNLARHYVATANRAHYE